VRCRLFKWSSDTSSDNLLRSSGVGESRAGWLTTQQVDVGDVGDGAERRDATVPDEGGDGVFSADFDTAMRL
jgi:hypothetical protein